MANREHGAVEVNDYTIVHSGDIQSAHFSLNSGGELLIRGSGVVVDVAPDYTHGLARALGIPVVVVDEATECPR